MKTSESVAGVMPALLKVQQEVGPVKKNANNTFHKSKYATLESVIDACYPALHSNGLVNVQTCDETDAEGKVVVVTRIYHAKTGEWVESRLPINVKKNNNGGYDPQGDGSAITYARRYTLMAILGMVAEDDDGEAAMQAHRGGYQNQTKQSTPQRQPKPPAPAYNNISTPTPAPAAQTAGPEKDLKNKNLALVSANKILAFQKQHGIGNEDILLIGRVDSLKDLVESGSHEELDVAYQNILTHYANLPDSNEPVSLPPTGDTTCTGCGKSVPEKVVEYCSKQNKPLLCYACQKPQTA